MLPEREAARKLFSVIQGNKQVTEYITEFYTIAAERRRNEEALTNAFFEGFNYNIKYEQATKD